MKAKCMERCKIGKNCIFPYELSSQGDAQPLDEMGHPLPRFCTYSETAEWAVDLKDTKTNLTINNG